MLDFSLSRETVFPSQPQIPQDILCSLHIVKPGGGSPAAHLLMVHLTTLCLSSVDANVKGTHKAIFLEMQRR